MLKLRLILFLEVRYVLNGTLNSNALLLSHTVHCIRYKREMKILYTRLAAY